MTVDYRGESFQHDWKKNTYSRPPVKVRFPCGKCGSARPEKWVQGRSGGWKLEVGKCCSSDTAIRDGRVA